MFPLRKPANVIADRLTSVFAAHDIQANQIPRLLPSIQYKDLESPKTLLPAITPAVIDTTAQLFGIRGAWLEGLDNTIYDVHWARGTPEHVLSGLAGAIAEKGREHNHFPLRVLTTSMNLDREGQHQQWLVPVIVETVDELGDTLVHRCHVFGNVYDWTREAARLPEGLPKADRLARLGAIAAELLGLEIEEERLTCEGETAGTFVPRRRDARPEIVLALPAESA